jgi:hypothetical protein
MNGIQFYLDDDAPIGPGHQKEAANEAARRAVNGILEHSGSDAPPCRLWDLHEPELLEPWRAHDRARYRKGLRWDDTGVRLALSALYRGATALEASIVNVVSSAMHVEDLLSYIRTGESRSALIQRLTTGPGEASGELLRAGAHDRQPGGAGGAVGAGGALLCGARSARRGVTRRSPQQRPLRRAVA